MTANAAPRLSADLLELARRHPRAGWPEHPRLGELGRFWLQRHDMFRQLDGILRDGLEQAIARDAQDEAMRRALARYLQLWFSGLQQHHHVEDHHYFPLFRALAPRLVKGFELLEADHDGLDAAIARSVGLARAWLGSERPDRAVLGRLHETHLAMAEPLLTHLGDEEDLIIPLLIERGEESLG
jgi:iron-sulfur cluster repair protein YtfE (RIC family)